jgi:hypothetical protein
MRTKGTADDWYRACEAWHEQASTREARIDRWSDGVGSGPPGGVPWVASLDRARGLA